MFCVILFSDELKYAMVEFDRYCRGAFVANGPKADPSKNIQNDPITISPVTQHRLDTMNITLSTINWDSFYQYTSAE